MVNQEEWDRDAPKLKMAGERLGARFTFASVEPMLERMEIDKDWMPSWIICGGESGPHARDMDAEWARYLRDQTRFGGAKFFMKQMSRRAPIPPDLMVREMCE